MRTCTSRGCSTTAEQGGHERISARSQDDPATECAYLVLHVNANRPRQRKPHLESPGPRRARNRRCACCSRIWHMAGGGTVRVRRLQPGVIGHRAPALHGRHPTRESLSSLTARETMRKGVVRGRLEYILKRIRLSTPSHFRGEIYTSDRCMPSSDGTFLARLSSYLVVEVTISPDHPRGHAV